MSYWAGKGLDTFAPQIKPTQPTRATAPWTERIQRAPESYGGNGVDSPVVDGKGLTTEDNRFNGKAVEQEGKVSAEQVIQAPSYSTGSTNAINQVIQAPGNKPPPEPTAPAQPPVEAMQVSSTAESVVQTDSASGKPLVSGSSQNISPAGLPRTMSRTEAAPKWKMMITNDMLHFQVDYRNTSNNPHHHMSNEASNTNTSIGEPTEQAAANQQSPSRHCCCVL